MTPDLRDKVILITGASRGIGRAVAVAAANAGAEIIITGRTIGALEESDEKGWISNSAFELPLVE
jgi:NAD(P)-dependent dehydrogenase (short-subunit alcohol dehydrogenase family)